MSVTAGLASSSRPFSSPDETESKASIMPALIFVAIMGSIQIILGSGPGLVVTASATLIVSLLPLALLGRDIYGLLSAFFGIRYVGIAIVLKTVYGETLDSHLLAPQISYALTFCVIVCTTAAISLARFVDRGRSRFPTPQDTGQLRLLSIACIAVGSCAELMEAASKSTISGEVNSGILFVLANAFTSFFILGLTCEATYAHRVSKGETFLTSRLMALLGMQLCFALALNVREFFITCILSVICTAYLLKCMRWRHLVLAAVAGLLFISFLSPITLFLRTEKEGLSFQAFVSLVGTTVSQAATDPAFLHQLTETQKYQSLYEEGLVAYDYYGDRSNVANRLSYVALLDAVYYGMSQRTPLGFDGASEQVLSRVLPSFIVAFKEQKPYTYGDWLSWQAGMSEQGRAYSANFGLAQEGYARFGFLGLILFPFIFICPHLMVSGVVSTLRSQSPSSMFFFIAVQHNILEGVSDTYIASATRTLPVIFFGAFVIYKVCGVQVLVSSSLPMLSRIRTRQILPK